MSMRRLISISILFSLSFSFVPARAADGLFGLFRRNRRVQTFQVAAQCVQPTYQVAYQQAVNYIPVATVPLATVPVAVDLQAYQYSINAGYFTNWRELMAQQAGQVQARPASPEPAQAAPVSTSEDPRLAGAIVLKQNCISCHQKGNKPKSDFAIFDEKGDMYTSLPFAEMLERINSADPQTRMPPRKTLASQDIMAVFRLASSSLIQDSGTRIASEPAKLTSPWD